MTIKQNFFIDPGSDPDLIRISDSDPDFVRILDKWIEIRISDSDPDLIRISDFRSGFNPDFGFQVQI
jgi:hypothetical protein